MTISPHQKKGQGEVWFDLFTVDKYHIKKSALSARNNAKSWEYGYNEKHDVVVISKTGQIGEVYDINGLKIALPLVPEEIDTEHDKWVAHDVHPDILSINSKFDWDKHPKDFRAEHVDYITREMDRREHGYWFQNNGSPTYMTGHHYMYLQHTKTDVGHPDYREANRIFFIFWEACKADSRCFGMIYLKIRRSGFSFMGSSVAVDTATQTRDAKIGILSKTGGDAKSLFTGKVVPISTNYPFFFQPLRSGMDRPKTEILYSLPASKITRRNMHQVSTSDDIKGLNTTIDWKNTDDNSYDGEKLKLLLHDESSKWQKPSNITNNWKVTKTCLRVGKRKVGKCIMGSTCNALANGGQEFKDIYENSDPLERSKNGETRSGLYRLFIPMEWNFEGYIDEFGFPVFSDPGKPVMGVDGEMINEGAIDYWNNEVEALKNDPHLLNEHYRQFPRTESHAFRDESEESIFNLTKIYDQIDINEGMGRHLNLVRGSFSWKDGKKDTEVIFSPDRSGRFLLSWLPPAELQNRVLKKGELKKPMNSSLGAFGCDPYDIAGVVGGGGSKASMHGLTKANTNDQVPSKKFFLEYLARPDTAEIFFEDVVMAIHFYGMPILIENNKARLLYYLKNRGYRAFSIDRPDKPKDKLSKTERELGGIPNSSVDVIQLHADCISTYIEEAVGYDRSGRYRPEEEPGDMPFERTLRDWGKFKISDRTKRDASISSGLAIMATIKDIIMPTKKPKPIFVNFAKYDNSGRQSKILN